MTGFDGALNKLEFDKVVQRIIRYAVSDPGRELLGSLRVLTSRSEIRRQLTRVSECKTLLEQEGEIPLQGICAVRTAVQKGAVEGTMLLPKDLIQIASTLRAARLVRSFLARTQESFPNLWESAAGLVPDKVLEFNIDQAVDEAGSVKASASRELQTIRRGITERYDRLRKRLEGILREVSDLGFSQEEIITTREGRMVIPVKSEHKNRVPGFIHSASASGATVFVEPTETLELNNEIRSLQFEEQREVERILRGLTTQIGASRDRLLENLAILADLDALSAKAKYSIEILGISPDISDGGMVRLVQARHPLLLISHGRQATVPLDVELADSFHTLVISGPNAGGKSVAMKCVGLLVLMAQAGLHIPAAEGSTLRVFQAMFVEIGDEQSIENDLSTFSSHLAHLREIIEQATADSLVLIDEIGSGTDPAEGSAIATSTLEALTSRNTCTIATTHQGSLKVFAHATNGVENAAMEFDQQSLTPTYRLRIGIPGSSYALEMASRLGFSKSFLERARLTLGEHESKLERLISDLETDAVRYRRELEGVTQEKARLDELVREYEARMSRLSIELRDMKRKAVEEADQIVAKANTVIEQGIKEIRESAGARDAVKNVRAGVNALKKELSAAREALHPPQEVEEEPPALEPGSPVRLDGRTDTGEILEVSSDRTSAIVAFGSVKMRVSARDLRKATAEGSISRAAQDFRTERQGGIPRELDLRGLTGDEAIPLIDKFLDDAFLAGLSRVDVIHGKGTGALRRRVTEFLTGHPRVRSFRLGQWNEGGDGATIVEIAE